MDWPKQDDPFQTPRSAAALGREFDEEVAFHIEMRTAELVDQGFSPDEARREALRRFGDLSTTRKACVGSEARRDHRRELHRILGDMQIDVRHALRQIARRPLFAMLVVATLAIGIGASTAIWSVADQILFRPLPYADSERIVTLWQWDRERDERTEVASGNFVSWVERSSSFESLGLAEPSGVDLFAKSGPPVALQAWSVTQNFFDALGVRPILGRSFDKSDYERIAECREYRCYADPVVVLSYEFWQSQFGGDPSIVGRDLIIDQDNATVVGVLPPGIDYPDRKPIWQPLLLSEEQRNGRRADYMLAVGRLATGVEIEQAQADLTRIATQLAEEFPDTNRQTGFTVMPLRDEILGSVRQGIGVLFVAAVILLLIACANVANLMLVRGASRTGETAVRAAIGAGRERLVRQHATESAVMAVMGGVAGAIVAFGGVAVLRRIAPPETPRIDTLSLDPGALPVSIGLAVVTSLLFGLLPALRSSRVSTSTLLRSSSGSSSLFRVRLRSVIVAAEIALALVLLTSAGLLGKSFLRLTSNDLGFEPTGRVSLQMFLWDRNPTAEARINRMEEYEERFRAIPGVNDVGIVSSLPFHPHAITATGSFRLDGMLEGEEPTAYTTIASDGYFKAMGIPVLRGRAFSRTDDAAAPPVALVSERFARAHFPNGDAIGKQIEFGAMSRPLPRTIVGVVGDVRAEGFDASAREELFIPYRQSGTGHTTFVVDSRLPEETLTRLLQTAVSEVDPLQPIYHLESMGSLVRHTLAERRFHLDVILAFTVAALLLAFIGTYGLMSFTTRQRSSEIGVRMAVGASSSQILVMVVRNGMVLGLLGSFAGLIGALWISTFLSGMLYGVEPTDVTTLVQVVVAMIGLSGLSALVPAWKISKLDPARTLRED